MMNTIRSFGVLVVGVLLGMGPQSWALSDAEQALFKAAAAGDDQRLAMGLSEVDPNVRNADGETLLMVAARAGDFESLQAGLEWR